MCNSNIGLQMITQKAQKSVEKFICEKCDFICSRKGDYNRHVATQKHKRITNDYTKSVKSVISENNECICGKSYKYRQGLYKHRLQCSTYLLANSSNEVVEYNQNHTTEVEKKNIDNDDVS